MATTAAPCLCGSVQNILWCINDKNAHKAGIVLSKPEPSAHSPASLIARGNFIPFEVKIDIHILWIARFWLAAPTADAKTGSAHRIFSKIQMISKSETWGQEIGVAVLAKEASALKTVSYFMPLVRQILICKCNDITILQNFFAARPIPLPNDLDRPTTPIKRILHTWVRASWI